MHKCLSVLVKNIEKTPRRTVVILTFMYSQNENIFLGLNDYFAFLVIANINSVKGNFDHHFAGAYLLTLLKDLILQWYVID